MTPSPKEAEEAIERIREYIDGSYYETPGGPLWNLEKDGQGGAGPAALAALDTLKQQLAEAEGRAGRAEAAVNAAARYIGHLSDVNLNAVVDARVLDDFREWQRAVTAFAIVRTALSQGEGEA